MNERSFKLLMAKLFPGPFYMSQDTEIASKQIKYYIIDVEEETKKFSQQTHRADHQSSAGLKGSL